VILCPRTEEIRHFHLFCGLGGGAKGMNMGRSQVGHVSATFRCIGGVDSDAAAIRDFERLAGCRGTVLDLFSREQYRAFHGVEPPDGWREATPEDIRRAAGYERPHIGFGSAPCKGFSGLLSESKSKSDKYHALNQLALRGLRLALQAWADDPLEFWLWENVPRIATRGRPVLDEMRALFEEFGYASVETTHDCGELGELAQTRKRFLLVARHRAKVPPFLYEPPKRRVRGVGEVIGELPVPGPEVTLPMHRLPMLQWQTWVRLAFVEAGSDWRSLNRLKVANGVLQDYALVPAREWNHGALGVRRGTDPGSTVTANGRPAAGAFSVADPRIDGHAKSVQHGVGDWAKPAAVVKGDVSVGTGRYAVADPRYADGMGEHTGKMRVEGWQDPSHTVTGSDRVGSGALSVADPRVDGPPRFNNVFRIVPFESPSQAVTGGTGVVGGAVADPRLSSPKDGQFKHSYRVIDWEKPSGTVTSAHAPSNGGLVVADPRVPETQWEGPGRNGVLGWSETSGAIAGESLPSNGKFAVADPRVGLKRDDDSAFKDAGGAYGVVPWDSKTGTVAAASSHDNGRWSVGDPRQPAAAEPLLRLPAPKDRLIAVIQALDGTYHRPSTTLELAFIQSLLDEADLDALVTGFALDGKSDSAWRERIGNAVPPHAARAVASVMGTTLLLAWAGETFLLSDTPIWVNPHRLIEVALTVDAAGAYE
jgi:site-specific DNA-cytosine methylase